MELKLKTLIAMKRFFILFTFVSMLLAACNPVPDVGVEEPDPTPDIPTPPVVEQEESPVKVALVRATDTTITIGWTITDSNKSYIGDVEPAAAADYTVDITKEYKV